VCYLFNHDLVPEVASAPVSTDVSLHESELQIDMHGQQNGQTSQQESRPSVAAPEAEGMYSIKLTPSDSLDCFTTGYDGYCRKLPRLN
jgi:hypothetical protein